MRQRTSRLLYCTMRHMIKPIALLYYPTYYQANCYIILCDILSSQLLCYTKRHIIKPIAILYYATYYQANCYIVLFLFFIFLFHLTYSRWSSSLPSCLWSQKIFPSLPGSRLTIFLSRCKFSTLTTRQPMVEFYLLTFPRFPLRKKEH